MRYIMKGGVWKNSEDQILKAAIMKYGLNQWSRISSLLQRKSAKQCKQRWYEWLDPSIKKTEWTRAEDQKLLQLSRVFPSQWRTIAPFVGRTPTQCYERYEKLLDIAQGKSIKQAEDLRKLRPGEIDPNPETKPARLDPIDMDEDEKEMLAEVRVRLANTKGKKAKRKEREKVIEEARRLARLQKIRELEMAGVENIPTAKEIKRMKQRKENDYNRQIPFKRETPEFVYRMEEAETPKNTGFSSTITLQTLEGKRRDVEEELQRKLDKRRMKKYKERDFKSALQLKSDFQKPAYFPIKLPEPQIGEKDLQSMKKFNITSPMMSQLLSNVNNETPFGMTPNNKIMFSAKVNLSLNHQEATPSHQSEADAVDGVEGLQYLKQIERNKFHQPMRSIDRVLSERMKTPVNQWEEDKAKLKSLFKNLKKPENIIEFEIPEEDEEEEVEQAMDAQEAQRLETIDIQKRQEQMLKIQTQVIRKKYERSNLIPISLKPSSKNQVNKLIEEEMISLIYSDAIDYPSEGRIIPEEPPAYKEDITYQQMEEARQLIRQEALNKDQPIHLLQESILLQKNRIKFDFNKKECKILQKPQNLEDKEISELLEYYRINLESQRAAIKKTEHNEKKTKKLLAGFEKIMETKREEVNNLKNELEKCRIERLVLQNLELCQKRSIRSRQEELENYYKLIYKAI